MVDVHQVIITQEQPVYFVVMPLISVLTVLMGRYVIVVLMGTLLIRIQINVKYAHCSDVWYANRLLLVANVTVGFIWTRQHLHVRDAHQQRLYKGVRYAAHQQFV